VSKFKSSREKVFYPSGAASAAVIQMISRYERAAHSRRREPTLHPKKTKVLALNEAEIVTAPARIVLNFAEDCRDSVDLTVVTFVRDAAQAASPPRQTHQLQVNDLALSSADLDAGRQSVLRPSPLDNPAPRNPFLASAADRGISVVTVRESGRFDLAALSQLKHFCREYKPDIVQTNSIKSHFLLSMLRKRNFGWLAFHHGYTAEDLKIGLYNQLDRFSLKDCNQVVTVCNAFARDLENQGVRREKITVIPNGISTGFMKQGQAGSSAEQIARRWRARFDIAPGDSVLLSIGRLSSEKGHQYLLAAVSRIAHSGSHPNLKLLIAGAGPLEQSLQRQIHAARLTDSAKLIGYQDDVRPLFMLADLFVLPSVSEGSPMVLLESMASQVPIITTNVGGIPEALTDRESALLVPPANARALSDAILKLLTGRLSARRLADAAFERVRDCFSPELYNGRVLQAFENLMARQQFSRPSRVPVME